MKAFAVAQIKALILPAITFTILFNHYPINPKGVMYSILDFFLTGGLYWFMLSLFIAKMLYYITNRYIKTKIIKIAVFLVLSLCGVVLNQVNAFPNYFVCRQALDLSVFLALGNIIGKDVFKKKYIITAGILYISITFLYLFVIKQKLPYVTCSFGTAIHEWPIHLILATAGTIIVLNFSEFIKKERLLEYIGRNSLFIYLVQWQCITILMGVYRNYLDNGGIYCGIISVILIIVNTIAIGLLTSYVFSNKYLKYTIGKF